MVEDPTTQTATKVINPLLARVHMPGSTFTLPSGGIFYKNGELSDDVEHGEVHVHPMTAFDEILVKTPDLLFSGEAVEKVFTRCIPQVLKPLDLFAKDIDFLMVCLRKITFGDIFEISYTHTCEDAKSHPYNINIGEFITSAKRIDPTSLGRVYTKTLPNEQVVKLKPAQFKNVIKMLQDIDPNADFTPEQELKAVMDTVMSVIDSVDGVDNPEFIREWLDTLNAKWIQQLSDAIDTTSDWGPSFMFKSKCKDCGDEIEINAPINPISFFT